MKNKKLLSLLLVIVILFTTGCGADNYIKDAENKIVTNNKTGQTLQKDIFCKPSKDIETYKLYEEYEDQMPTKLEDLPECSAFRIKKTKTDGIWSLIFVKPVAFVILKLGNLLRSWGLTKAYLGLALIIIGILIRVVLLPINIKTQNQSKNMQKLQPEMQKLEKKYAGRNDQESMMAKSQEMMMLYKKYKVNPMLSCILALIQLPIFFAFLQAINRVPAIFEGKLLGFNLGMTPYVGLSKGNYLYILLIILIALSTYFSFKYSMNSAGAMAQGNSNKDQMKMMTNIMVVMIVITSFSLSTALSFYWITTYAFIAIQTYLFKRLANKNKDKKIDKNKIKDKLKVKEGLKYGSNK